MNARNDDFSSLFAWMTKHHHLYTDPIELANDAIIMCRVEGETTQVAWDLADSFLRDDEFIANEEKWKG